MKKDVVSFYDITKDEKLKYLDEFLNYYEWCVVRNGDKFDLFDLQTKENVWENDTIEEIISHAVGRAIDYYKTEWQYEIDDYLGEDCLISSLEDFYTIAKKYTDKGMKVWLDNFRDFLDNLEQEEKNKWFCMICGEKKEDYESAYCEKCLEKEEERLKKNRGV